MKKSARAFAIESHGNQKYGKYPYSWHLDEVAKKARAFGEVAEVIAYLHDVVEDTPVTVEEIEKRFGKLVANCVAVITDETGKNRQERKAKTYRKMATVSGETELALIVKVCDRLSNLQTSVKNHNSRMLNIYQQEHPVFRASAYRKGLCDDLWAELEQLIDASKKQ